MLHILKGFFALIALCITSCCFLGFVPSFISKKAGLDGGLMGCLIGLGLLIYIFINNQSIELVIALIVITFLLGLFLISPAEYIFYFIFGDKERYTGNNNQKNNYYHTIIDKVHGQLIAGLPIFFMNNDYRLAGTVFFIISWYVFQHFYTSKTGLIKRMTKENQGKGGFKGSFWIMIDATVAGIFTAVLTSLYLNFFV